MATTVKLRKPRMTSGSTSSSSGGKFTRPRSWNEFNTRFQAVTVPIDLTPVPQLEDEAVRKREPNNYRKVRPLSQPILDQKDRISSSKSEYFRPPSPKYTSFMVPNPWRDTSGKNEKTSIKKVTSGNVKANEQLSNYDETSYNYDITKSETKNKIMKNNAPQAKTNETFSNTNIRHNASISDAESSDSGFVLSGGSTPHATSSEKSPRWRNISRTSSSFESEKSGIEFQKLEKQELNKKTVDTLSVSLTLPQIIISKEKDKMQFFTEDDIFQETGNYAHRPTVPSPLKACYSPVNTYDDLVEYSDSENSSGEETSGTEYSMTNFADKKPQPIALPRQSSVKESATTGNDVKSGTWPRRQIKKNVETHNPEEMMKKFRETRENHLKKFEDIYAQSRKRIDEVMIGLKQTMTDHGYREWYPRIR